jgi:branched-subunit amino acid transport protein AzlD
MPEKRSAKLTRRDIRKWMLMLALLMLPVYEIVDHFSGGGKARAAAGFVAILTIVIAAFWNLRRRAWFWLSIAALTTVHVVLIIVISWSNRDFPAPELWPIGIADYLAMYGFIKLVERAMS